MNIQLKMNYKTEKMMKKFYGKYQGRQLAFGRNLLKSIGKIYNQPERLKRSDAEMQNDSPNSTNK